MTDDTSELRRLFQELSAMPGYPALGKVRTFGRCKGIFDGNLRELLSSFDIVRDDPAGNFIVCGEGEFARRLHNFVSAALALVDHARGLYQQHYASTGAFDDYQTRVDATFKYSPRHCFIQGLRNYCLHYEVPESWYTFENFAGQQPKSSFFLPCDNLERWDGWSNHAKGFIEAARPRIEIRTEIQQYASEVEGFYQWFYARLSEIHTSDIEAIESKQREIESFQRKDRDKI